MIVTDRFVYLHLHKSGGTFVNECLLRFFPDARQIGYHLPRSLIPPASRELPILGFVRNPWSYYVSWYAFQSQRAQPNALFRVVSDDGRLGFKDTVSNLLTLGSDERRLNRVLETLPAQYMQQGLNLPSFALAPIRGSNLGFYSYLYFYMYGDKSDGAFIGRIETLRNDFMTFLKILDIGIDPRLQNFIMHENARNASQHAAWRDYYDTALADAVAKYEQPVNDAFNYRFDN